MHRKEGISLSSSIYLSWFLSLLSLLLYPWVYLCPFRMWQQSKPMCTSLCLCVCSSLIILMGMKDISIFCPTFPQVLCFRVGGRSWGPSRECPGPLPLVVLSHLFGGGPGLWYLEVCNSQVLCPWSGAVPGSYFGGKWITSPSQLVPLRKLVYLLLLLLLLLFEQLG